MTQYRYFAWETEEPRKENGIKTYKVAVYKIDTEYIFKGYSFSNHEEALLSLEKLKSDKKEIMNEMEKQRKEWIMDFKKPFDFFRCFSNSVIQNDEIKIVRKNHLFVDISSKMMSKPKDSFVITYEKVENIFKGFTGEFDFEYALDKVIEQAEYIPLEECLNNKTPIKWTLAPLSGFINLSKLAEVTDWAYHVRTKFSDDRDSVDDYVFLADLNLAYRIYAPFGKKDYFQNYQLVGNYHYNKRADEVFTKSHAVYKDKHLNIEEKKNRINELIDKVRANETA